MERTRIATIIAAVVASAAIAFGGGWLARGEPAQAEPNQPYCPTEDSCTADYRDGGWHIEEIIP